MLAPERVFVPATNEHAARWHHRRGNIFGRIDSPLPSERSYMADADTYLARTDAPIGHARETLDARELPPPQPLKNTLERLAAIPESTVLVQLNDRRPQHLYPRLEERGYRYETFEDDGVSVTVIWSE